MIGLDTNILINGQMRSGTTLLCNFLNSQDGIWG